MIVSRYFLWFIIYSFFGWVYETIVMTIYERKWDNRGFLFGPICPIYGLGALGISIIVEKLNSLNIAYSYKELFIIAFFGSMILEYFTGWLLETLFHAYWWDYSKVPFNIKGRICLPASVGFGFAGIIVVYYIYPFVNYITFGLTPLSIEILALILMLLLSIDTALTAAALISFEKRVLSIEDNLNQYMEVFVESLQEKTKNTTDKVKTLLDKFSSVRFIKNMGYGQKSAIKRVLGFRNKERNSKLDFIFKMLKNRTKIDKIDEDNILE